MIRYRARYILADEQTLTDATLSVDAGLVSAIDHGPFDLDLGEVALVPGCVNAHSHAFQRLLRGRTEHLEAARPHEDFWSWRTLMYEAALRLGPEQVEAVSAMAFLEMARAGYTTVGEFHYLHHDPAGQPYADPNELAYRVVRAARRVGLRIRLLRVAYHRAGRGRPALAEQRRFVDPDLDTCLKRIGALHSDDPLVSFGLAPHSVRAVPAEWIAGCAELARARGWPLHIHACEQRRELEECRAEHGVEPVALLERLGALGPRSTLVHATHLATGDAARLSESTVCACPTTERNLGDGFLPAEALLEAGVPVAIGSDSQAQIDPFAELRALDGHARLQAERRNVLARFAPTQGGQHRSASVLWPMATLHGARALGLPVGRLAVGAPADFLAIDLRAPELLGLDAASLIDHLCFSTQPRHVRDSYVAGRPLIEAGCHAHGDAICDDYRAVLSALRG